VAIMADSGPYAKEIKILSDKIAKGEKISKRDRIYQYLDDKRNIGTVQVFLSTNVDSNLTE
jgi:hypothetical protein